MKVKILLFLMLSVLLNAENIKVQLLKNIVIAKESGEVKSKILLESSKENYLFVGTYSTTNMLSGNTKVEVDWHTVKKGKAEKDLNNAFKSRLSSNKDIQKEAEFKATGDKEELISKLNELDMAKGSNEIDVEDNDLLSSVNALGDISSLDDEKATSPTSDTGSMLNTSEAQNAGTPAANYQAESTNPTSSNNYEDTTNLEDISSNATDDKDAPVECPEYIINGENVQFQTAVGNECIADGSPVPLFEIADGCTPKIDYDKKTVTMSTKKIATHYGDDVVIENCSLKNETIPLKNTFNGCNTVFRKDQVAQVQQEQYYYTYNNQDVKVGSCVDSTTIYPVSTFIEVNEICKPLINFESRTVQYAFRKVANVDDNLVELEPCRYETVTHPLLSTYDGATIKHDFINGKSIQYEQFYYEFNNQDILVGDPRPSSLEWNHFLTDQTCSPVRVSDEAVVYNQRTAYKNNAGIINYISECKPYEDSQLILNKEFGGYEHDYVNNQSYPKTREYFLHPDTNARTYINEFSRESINFPHLEEHVRWEHHDSNLNSTEYVKKYFVDNIYSNGNVYIEEASEVSNGTTVYSKSSYRYEFLKNLGNTRLKKINNKYYFYNDDTKEIDLSNGNYPSDKSGVFNITSLRKEVLSYAHSSSNVNTLFTGICVPAPAFFCYAKYYYNPTHNVSYSNCSYGDILNSTKSYPSKNRGTFRANVMGIAFYNTGNYNKSYTHKDCSKWQYLENISEYQLVEEFFRPDGTIYEVTREDLLYRIVK